MLKQFTCIVGLALILLTAGSSPAVAQQPDVAPEILRSTVMVSDLTRQNCGTGFILNDGRVVTNAHIVRGICPTSHCSVIHFYLATSDPTIQEKIETKGATRVNLIQGGLDLAILTPGWKDPRSGIFELSKSGSEASVFSSFGFTECSQSRLTGGKIIDSNSLHLYTSLTGKAGMSGAPVFDAENRLVAVVDESSSFLAALKSRLIGGTFRLRAVKASVLNQIADSSDPLNREIELLLGFYQKSVLSKSGWDRTLAAIDFLGAYEGLRSLNASELSAFTELTKEELLAAIEDGSKEELWKQNQILLHLAAKHEENGTEWFKDNFAEASIRLKPWLKVNFEGVNSAISGITFKATCCLLLTVVLLLFLRSSRKKKRLEES